MAWGLSLSTSQSTNEAGNQSTVNATLFLTWSNANRYSGFTTSGSINIGGNVLNFTGPTSGGSTAQTGSQALASHSVTFTHDANGFRGAVGTSGSFDASGTSTIAPQNLSTSGTTFGAIDYDRKPAAPSTVTPTLNADKSITVTSNAVNSPAGTATYYIQWASSENNSTWSGWSGETTIGSNARTITYSAGSLTFGLWYKFRMRASNSDGFSAYTESSSLLLSAAGKRFTGSGWVNSTTGRIYNGTSWVPLTTAKRYNGTSWVNIT
jgi:hypothetical protein